MTICLKCSREGVIHITAGEEVNEHYGGDSFCSLNHLREAINDEKGETTMWVLRREGGR